MNPIPVVAALILRNGRVLLARRKSGKSQAGCWEFPGGKMEEGEHPESALIREIKEELGIRIRVVQHFHTSLHAYSDIGIRLIAFLATTDDQIVNSSDHDVMEWVSAAEILNYNLAPADVETAEKWQEWGEKESLRPTQN